MTRAGLLCALALAGACAGRPPPVDQLVARLGPERARAELRFRVASHPDDLPARRALARLEEDQGRPGAAIEQLLAVERAGGPLGPRWSDADRARLARLLVQRGMHRVRREAAAGLADLEHARRLGASVAPINLEAGRMMAALADLRHASADVRARGRAAWAKHDPSARADATLELLGRFGAGLWSRGARRAALEVLAEWQAKGGTDPAILDALLRARRWWSVPGGAPFEADARDAALATGAPPATAPATPAPDPALPCLPDAAPDDAACSPRVAAGDESADGPAWEPDLVHAAADWPRATDGDVAAAWTVVTLRASLRDGTSWLPAIGGRVDAAAALGSAPAWARPTLLRAAGRRDDALAAVRAVLAADLAPGPRLVVAAEAAIAGLPATTVRAVLAPIAESAPARALLDRVAPPALADPPAFAALAAEVAAGRRIYGAPELAPALAAAARAYTRDPALTDRLLDDAIATQVDAAVGLGAAARLVDALGDAARARALWARAAAETGEPAIVLEHALACARAGDGDAALLHLTEAAAGSGDASPMFTAAARALLDGGQPIHALEAARQAIDLAGPDAIGDALAAAAAASTAAGRTEQAARLVAERAALTGVGASDPDDPTDAEAAVAAAGDRPGAVAIAALVVAARWSPRDVASRRILAGLPAADPRGRRARAELAALAREDDPAVARAALAALRETQTGP